MPKSRKQKLNCKNKETTMYGLQLWYVSMVEKLGWMILAKSKDGVHDKLISYKQKLFRLEEKIKCKMNTIHDIDNQNDLRIMLNDVQLLVRHIDNDF